MADDVGSYLAVAVRSQSRMAARYVGVLYGDLDALGLLIKTAIVHNAGDEFLVWVDDDGMVFVAPDTTRESKGIAARHPDWVVNNYRSRWEIRGERFQLPPSAITEDLAYFRDQRGKA